jgi:putative transposase
MKFNPHFHHQPSIRLIDYDYFQPRAYFFTLMTEERINLYGDIGDGELRVSNLGKFTRTVW